MFVKLKQIVQYMHTQQPRWQISDACLSFAKCSVRDGFLDKRMIVTRETSRMVYHNLDLLQPSFILLVSMNECGCPH